MKKEKYMTPKNGIVFSFVLGIRNTVCYEAFMKHPSDCITGNISDASAEQGLALNSKHFESSNSIRMKLSKRLPSLSEIIVRES
jgi:hypothetical protein